MCPIFVLWAEERRFDDSFPSERYGRFGVFLRLEPNAHHVRHVSLEKIFQLADFVLDVRDEAFQLLAHIAHFVPQVLQVRNAVFGRFDLTACFLLIEHVLSLLSVPSYPTISSRSATSVRAAA